MKTTDIALYAVTLVFCVILIYILFLIKTDGVQCMANPLVYGVNKTAQAVGSEFSCICSFADTRYLRMQVTPTGLSPVKPIGDYGATIPLANLSALEAILRSSNHSEPD